MDMMALALVDWRSVDGVGRRVLRETGTDPSHAMFIGDGWTDFKTAQACGVHFVLLREMSDWAAVAEQTRGAANVSVCATWAEITARCRDK